MSYLNSIRTRLVFSRPFSFDVRRAPAGVRFYLTDPSCFDPEGIAHAIDNNSELYCEDSILSIVAPIAEKKQRRLTAIKDFTSDSRPGKAKKVAFLASSDTHVNFMLKIAADLDDYLFLIPALRNKDENAALRLREAGETYAEVAYDAQSLEALDDVGIVFCAADWTSEFIALKRCIGDRPITTIVLQEGPQDWHMRFVHKSVLKIQNHCRNADVLFAQGGRTLDLIRAKAVAVTGNPKIDLVRKAADKKEPRVLINCNFTYIETKPAYEDNRDLWLGQVISACRQAGIAYTISQHPRDTGHIRDPNLRSSHAGVISEQLRDCTIVISRFSSITYEALAHGAESVYFNPHLEPMATFNAEPRATVPVIRNAKSLADFLERHKDGHRSAYEDRARYLRRHIGPCDGEGRDRIISTLKSMSSREAEFDKLDVSRPSSVSGRPGRSTAKGTVAIFSKMPSAGYSGGRYHALMKAEAFAAAGYRTFLVMDNYPTFFGDFKQCEEHQNIEVVLTENFKPDFPPDADLDLVICVPGMDRYPTVYYGALKAATDYSAKLALLNFESPNWFNVMSPVLREEKLWQQWCWLAKYCDAIISSADEGTRYAREYYTGVPKDCLFITCQPAINSVAADLVDDTKQEIRVFAPTRFALGEHKGGAMLPELIDESWRGVKLSLLMGHNDRPDDWTATLFARMEQFGVEAEFLDAVDDQKKFRAYHSSCLTLFPSYFEGFGLPPVESLYCGTPCVAFDLPILKETCGEALTRVPVGDWTAFKAAVSQHISAFRAGQSVDRGSLRQAVTPIATIESYAERADALFQQICGRPVDDDLSQQRKTAVARAPAVRPKAVEAPKISPLVRLKMVVKSALPEPLYLRFRTLYRQIGRWR